LLTLLAAKDDKLLIIEKELSLLKEQGFENTTTVSSEFQMFCLFLLFNNFVF